MWTVTKVDLLVDRISRMIENPANIMCHLQVTKRYIWLAVKTAERLEKAGRKQEAGDIRNAIRPFYEIILWPPEDGTIL